MCRPADYCSVTHAGHVRLVRWFVEVLGVGPDHASAICAHPAEPPSVCVPPFYAACANGHLAVAEYLLRCGFDTRGGPPDEPARAAARAALAARGGSYGCGEDVSEDEASEQLAALAAARRSLSAVRFEVSGWSGSGRRPSSASSSSGSSVFSDPDGGLEAAGASDRWEAAPKTPAYIAAELADHTELCSLILRTHSDQRVSHGDNAAHTALHKARIAELRRPASSTASGADLSSLFLSKAARGRTGGGSVDPDRSISGLLGRVEVVRPRYFREVLPRAAPPQSASNRKLM
eukprot:SAG11_NODE_1074_length_5968_cov_2.041063_3_plen_291_part_00